MWLLIVLFTYFYRTSAFTTFCHSTFCLTRPKPFNPTPEIQPQSKYAYLKIKPTTHLGN